MNSTSTFPVEYRFVDINGLRTFYRAAGNPANPAVVLLHGFPSSSHMFRDLIPLLADRFRVIAPDYIGFGHSSAPTVDQFDYSFDRLANHVQALLDKLEVRDAVFYMQDYGGPIGMRLVTAHPERVKGLVIQNANAYMEGLTPAVAAVFMPLWEKGDESGALGMLQAATTQFQYTEGARNPAGVNPDAWTHDQRNLDGEAAAARQMALFKDYAKNPPLYDTWQAYFRQHQPRTLVAWGKGDPFFGVQGAEAYRRDLSDVRIELLDSGHFALEEDAALVAQLIKHTF